MKWPEREALQVMNNTVGQIYNNYVSQGFSMKKMKRPHKWEKMKWPHKGEKMKWPHKGEREALQVMNNTVG